MNGKVTVELLTDGTPMTVDLVDMQGRVVNNIYIGKPEPGKFSLNWNSYGVAP